MVLETTSVAASSDQIKPTQKLTEKLSYHHAKIEFLLIVLGSGLSGPVLENFGIKLTHLGSVTICMQSGNSLVVAEGNGQVTARNQE
jgi:hypothetical protein